MFDVVLPVFARVCVFVCALDTGLSFYVVCCACAVDDVVQSVCARCTTKTCCRGFVCCCFACLFVCVSVLCYCVAVFGVCRKVLPVFVCACFVRDLCVVDGWWFCSHIDVLCDVVLLFVRGLFCMCVCCGCVMCVPCW